MKIAIFEVEPWEGAAFSLRQNLFDFERLFDWQRGNPKEDRQWLRNGI